jgi:hypothetical protein
VFEIILLLLLFFFQRKKKDIKRIEKKRDGASGAEFAQKTGKSKI